MGWHFVNDGKSVMKVGIVLGALMSGQLAQAQFEPRISGKPGEEHIRSSVGVSVQGGGGVTNFMGGSERNVTDVGGTWDIRAVLGTRSILALEGAYLGSARTVSAGVASGAGLVSNGLEGAFRLNAPFLAGETLVEPFTFVGLGWSHYSMNGLGGRNLASTSDDVTTLPVGAGLAIGYRGLIAEARFTYRPAFSDGDLLINGNGSALGLDTWNVGLMLGFEF